MFGFRAGARVKGISPDVAGAELERIREEAGALTPNTIVEQAAPEGAPLHPAFEWDNSVAAHEFRLHQARHLVRAVVVYDQEQPQAEPKSVYVHINQGEEGRYEPVSVVVRSPDMFQAAIDSLRGKLTGAQRAVDDLLTAHKDALTPSQARRAKAAHTAITKASQSIASL